MTTTKVPHSSIDAVARRMTSAQAPDLRDRVALRLPARRQRPSTVWPWWAAATATVLTIAAAVLPVGPRQGADAPAASVASVVSAPVQAAVQAAPAAESGAARARRVRSERVQGLGETELEWLARRPAALEIPPLASSELNQPEPVTVPLLEVLPLSVPAVEIRAIGASGGSR